MKFLIVSLLATLAAASPIAVPEPSINIVANDLEARQFGGSKSELESGSASACPKAILVFARGSTETGNLGTLGAPLGDALERKYGAANFWVQGVGGPYGATLYDNALPRGSSPAAIAEMVRLITMANTKCPNTPVVAGGYSQGAALAAAAITDLTATVRNQVVGTVLFGYTKNMQNSGAIPSYPSDRLKVFCAVGDLVCTGTLTITAAHLSYGPQASNEAPAFLISKIGN
ncbi:carbohydrate esterase family 5 protein [Dothidotthia symphoricarpi CBS 119687]|uniref:Cutinase n=1 Tax=Dothidotthia symphoricarpi CBS 119687 TaxID=1392245 RepID=A0A6A5ZZA3_9PLEO|nr:carbohydrate esterase family 5 protein [Dothidotthia symphoricarpi CBS 119687]KAF2124616.1 carbohydrate esterase family 5 protein [Dothidotthia symphoricarpi CBS 119687]